MADAPRPEHLEKAMQLGSQHQWVGLQKGPVTCGGAREASRQPETGQRTQCQNFFMTVNLLGCAKQGRAQQQIKMDLALLKTPQNLPYNGTNIMSSFS